MAPRLVPLPGPEPRHGRRQVGRRRPAGDGAGALPGLSVVSDPRKSAAQLDDGGQLTFLFKDGADRVGVGFCDHEHRRDVRSVGVASKRRAVQARAMSLRGFAWFKPLLPMTRWDRTRLAQLDGTRADLVAVADALRDLSSRLDARAHLVRKVARDRGGVAPDGSALDPDRTVMTVLVGDAVASTSGTASTLDQATEKLERVAAALRDV